MRNIEEILQSLLPLYANGRLKGLRRRMVVSWLARSPSARARLRLLVEIKGSLAAADKRVPAGAAWQRIQTEVRMRTLRPAAGLQLGWKLGMAVALLLAVAAWFMFPPTVTLEWRVEGSMPAAFQIYRAPETGGQDYRLLEEMPADDSSTGYRFVDLALLPGRDYAYRIDAIGADGKSVTSQSIHADAAPILPGQAAILLSALVAGYGLAVSISAHSSSREDFRLRTG